MTLCCTKTRRDLDCEAGRLAALAGEECSVKGVGESHRDCCLSCSLGILVASMGQRCSGVADMFGCPLEKPFSDCCEEMAGPFTNDTLDDLLSSMDDEESTTELKDEVCPEGFSHNTEMNVCDDLNEVSRLKQLFHLMILFSLV